ncbi:DUF6377 domain-containing protein [Dysgonomonas sp. BGC7]|uniref:DUF6377 domain-containing protein n=1 Tax=Dysgonomonas sp. BGC7 TaxID=1658008 RepID=UPI000681EED3|nr:DUF6377 domain-containing protein [Dysgonomonas sp. BGC7]MBD8388427.1 hypothetical protein [Dysgonomonas sp. BGC7]
MKNILLICFLGSYLASFAGSKDSIMIRLDEVMSKKGLYVNEKEQRILGLKQFLTLHDLSSTQLYDTYQKLYLEYKKFKTDSAVHYILKNRDIVKEIGNMELQYETELQLAWLYSTKGMYIEAKEILDKIKKDKIPSKLIPEYYRTCNAFYSHYALSNKEQKYYRRSGYYRDSLLLVLDPQSLEYQIEYATKELYDQKKEKATQLFKDLLDKTTDDNPNRALIAYFLGYTYKEQGNMELQKKYFSISAISDITNCIKDNASFQNLALTYYELGDIDKAYRFIQSAIEDAIFCNVRYRTIESSEFYPIINSTYLKKEKIQKEKLETYLFFISVLSLALLLGTIFIYKQMKKLSMIRKQLHSTNMELVKLNKDLQDTNSNLEEANLVKEEYIARFFDQCSEYVDKLENYRKSLNNKAKNNQLEDLFTMIKSRTLIDTELEELFHNFDSVFLNIYPSFIEEFNTLLMPSEQIHLKPGELLNTELRIFALIRLGITDSVKIANFLRYSLRTVYNYRTRVRNKAAGSRDEFEEIVKKIGTIKLNK